MPENNNDERENAKASVKRGFSPRAIAAAALVAVGVLCIGVWAFSNLNAAPVTASESSSASQAPSQPLPQAPEPSSEPQPHDPNEPLPLNPNGPSYPTDKLFITTERLDFVEGDLILRVPRLELITTIVGNISADDKADFLGNKMTPEEKASFLRNDNSSDLLSNGVMLFNLSPLPSDGNSNVCMSGHRDICGKEFYYIDTIGKGDMIYLDYLDKTYCYEYVDTVIVPSNDWSPIYCKDFSCVTLISCDPIGTHRNRIVVTGRLMEIIEQKDVLPPPPGSVGI